MKVCGIVAEYNPLHSGHQFHINKSKEITGADSVVAEDNACRVEHVITDELFEVLKNFIK